MKPTRLLSLVVALACLTQLASAAPAILSLEGDWLFQTDPGDTGEQAAWFAPDKVFERKIHLPGTTDEAGIGEPDAEGPGLVRRHAYIGSAWYARDIDIPQGWADKEVELVLERVLWKSNMWLDGKPVDGGQDSLSVAHRHALGRIAPGRHRLVLRIDNRKFHEIGNDSHAYSENTQSRWNGAVGRVALAARPASHLGRIRIFPGSDASAKVEAAITGAGDGMGVRVTLMDPKTREEIITGSAPVKDGTAVLNLKVPAGKSVTRWSEFTPVTYLAKVELGRDGKVLDTREESFGFRVIRREGNQQFLDDAPLFLRGNSESGNFLRHGYPSCRKEDWAKIWKLYKDYGMNYARFHSWCPPEAAFAAADEIGIVLEIEGPFWCALGHGKPVDIWAREESQRIFDAYGNHPSFCLFEFGNEMNGSNFKEMGRWNAAFKMDDPRRLYAASTAREVTEDCEFNNSHIVPGAPGYTWALDGNPRAATAWDLEATYGRSKVPTTAHEVGQVVTYPDWGIIDKASGTLRNIHMEKARALATEADVLAENKDFQGASGALQAILYKNMIEGMMRTPSCRGFEFLAMQDFPGQGDAYVGWLDMFWDSKGFVTPAEFRGYCAPEVAMASFPSWILTSGQSLSADLFVRNDGPADLAGRKLTAVLKDAAGKVVKTEKCAVTVARGEVRKVGVLSTPVESAKATTLTLELRLEGKAELNRYTFWVYPKDIPVAADPAVMVAEAFSPEVEKALADGKSVLLLAHKLGRGNSDKYATWKPCFWSTVYFSGQSPTLGAFVRQDHLALTDFPTGHFSDYQWLRLCDGAHGFQLDGIAPKGFRPLVQPVPDIHHQAKLGTLFECKADKGKLLVCGYDITEKRCREIPEAAQLRQSLVRYAASTKFRPTDELATADLKELFSAETLVDRQLPKSFEKADFFAAVAAEAPAGVHGGIDPNHDRILASKEGFSLQWLASEGTIKDNDNLAVTGRYGAKVAFQLDLPRGVAGTLWVKFREYDNTKGRTITIDYEDWKPAQLIEEPTITTHQGQWWKLKIRREDALDGKLLFTATAAVHPKFAITHVAFVPEGF